MGVQESQLRVASVRESWQPPGGGRRNGWRKGMASAKGRGAEGGTGKKISVGRSEHLPCWDAQSRLGLSGF